MDLAYEYTRRRADFGRHPKFDDADITNIHDREPTDEFDGDYVPREQTTLEIDCIPQISEHWVNTERFIQDDKGVNHLEGGWPKEVNTQEFSEKQRHIRKIETDATFEEQAHELALRAQAIVMQNNAIDVFETYFTDICEDHTGELPSAKTVTIFRDPHLDMPRGVSKISWHPDSQWKLAVSYCTLQFQKMPDNIPLNSYIWDVTNPNRPDFTIKPQSPLVTCVFNPKSTEHLAGGCYNGLIGFWDLRKGQTPVSKTLIEQSHNDPVYDIYWIQSRTGNEFSSVSTDGYIHWWDIRKLGSGPMDSMKLEGEDDGVVYGGTCMEYRTDAGATRFLIGTEQGMLMTIERKAKKDQESLKSVKAFYGLESGRHHGPVYSVERNFAFPKYILTVGDWAANIWMEDIRTPVMSTPYDPAYLTAGAWSPTRPGVFFTAKKDGVVDVWDYFYKQTEPIVALKIGEHPLTCMTPQANGKMLGIGSQDGTTTILEVCTSIVESTLQEKPAIISMFERETNREKNLQNRLLAQRRQAELEKKGKIKKKEGPSVEVPVVTAEQLKQSEDKFWSLVTKYKPDRSKYQLGDDAGKPEPETVEQEQETVEHQPEIVEKEPEIDEPGNISETVPEPMPSGDTEAPDEDEVIETDAGAIPEATKIESSITTVQRDKEEIEILKSKDLEKENDSLAIDMEKRETLSPSLDEYDSDAAQDAYEEDFENSKHGSRENLLAASTAIEVSDKSVDGDERLDELCAEKSVSKESIDDILAEKPADEAPTKKDETLLNAAVSEILDDGAVDLTSKSDKEKNGKLVSEASFDDVKVPNSLADKDAHGAQLRKLVSEAACDDGMLPDTLTDKETHGVQLRKLVSEAACDDGALQEPSPDGSALETIKKDVKSEKSTIATADDEQPIKSDEDLSLINNREIPTVGTDVVSHEVHGKMEVDKENFTSAQGSNLSDKSSEDDQALKHKSIEQNELDTKDSLKSIPSKKIAEPTPHDATISKDIVSEISPNKSELKEPKEQNLEKLEIATKSPTAEQVVPHMNIEPKVKPVSLPSNTVKDTANTNEILSTSEQKDPKKEMPGFGVVNTPAAEEVHSNNEDYEDEFETGNEHVTEDTSAKKQPLSPVQKTKPKAEAQPLK